MSHFLDLIFGRLLVVGDCGDMPDCLLVADIFVVVFVEEFDSPVVVNQCLVDEFEIDNRNILKISVQTDEVILRSQGVIDIEH